MIQNAQGGAQSRENDVSDEQARQFLFMRHADECSHMRDRDLSPAAGEVRAIARVEFMPSRCGPPAFIFASADSKHSARPLQTIQPQAIALSVFVDQSFADRDYPAWIDSCVGRARDVGRLTLVCMATCQTPHVLGARDDFYLDARPRDL